MQLLKQAKSLLPVVGITGVAIALVGCVHAPKWAAQRDATPDLIARVLDEPSAIDRGISPGEIPEIPVRANLRPCCAFGTDLQARLGPVPIPFFTLDNIIGVDELGPHKYDSGAFATSGSSTKNAFTSENNAMVYTCRGGFIDIAHVRDYADWTLFWSAAIGRASETGATVELPSEGGARRVVIRPLPRELIERDGLRRIVVNLAQWTAFQLSIWHEIATAYGWSAIDLYPEYVSAFSPEDLYSNLLGVKIAGGLLSYAGTAETDSLYDQNMDRWLPMTLTYLHAVSGDAGKTAATLVDGVWWNSHARLPDPHLVLRRGVSVGDQIAPWLVSQAYDSPEMRRWLDQACGGAEHPLVLRRRHSLHGVRFSDLVTFEVDVDVPDPFPFPRAGSHLITQADFPAIIEAVRQDFVSKLGPDVDRPDRRAG